jgi:hypothetical protein
LIKSPTRHANNLKQVQYGFIYLKQILSNHYQKQIYLQNTEKKKKKKKKKKKSISWSIDQYRKVTLFLRSTTIDVVHMLFFFCLATTTSLDWRSQKASRESKANPTKRPK